MKYCVLSACNSECGAHSYFVDGYGRHRAYCAKSEREIILEGPKRDMPGNYPPGDPRNFPDWCKHPEFITKNVGIISGEGS